MSNQHDDHEALIRLIAHELRSPLTAMQLNAQLIERAATLDRREKEQRWAGAIASSARRLEGMIQLLVEADRIRSGRIQLRRDYLVFSEWLEAVTVGWGGRRLLLTFADRSLAVSCDGSRLQRALLALVDITSRSAEPEAPLSIAVRRDAGRLRCSMRVPQPIAPTEERRQRLCAGHDIEVFYVRAVLEAHEGELGFGGPDEDAVGFDVVLPLTSSCT